MIVAYETDLKSLVKNVATMPLSSGQLRPGCLYRPAPNA